jgi:hypothetical protein
VNVIGCLTRGATTLVVAGCTSLSPQLPPPDFAARERLETRADREAAYREHELQVRNELVGTRYTIGTTPNQIPRGWTSLERVLQSNADSAAAIPEKKRRRARILTVLSAISGFTFVAGVGASAAEGFQIGKATPGNVIMLSSSVATLAFALSAGLVWNSIRDDYERAAEVYNRSLGLRLGIYDAEGRYLPPAGSLIEPDGSIVMFDQLPTPPASATEATDRTAPPDGGDPPTGAAAPAASDGGGDPGEADEVSEGGEGGASAAGGQVSGELRVTGDGTGFSVGIAPPPEGPHRATTPAGALR